MKVAVAIAAIVLLPVVAMAGDAPIRCAETGIRVPGWNSEERAGVCSASAAAIAFLREAGILYHADDLTIAPSTAAEDDEDGAHVIGRCDPLHNEIRVLTYDASVVASRRYPPAFDMPMSPALWQSFVSHETAHAVAEQNFAVGVRRSTASEYIAAVVQLATLPAELRKAILGRYGAEGFGDASEISLLSYELDPAVFAVMAYRHYESLGDRGPVFVGRLLREGLDQ
jgi:hypothetical protein